MTGRVTWRCEKCAVTMTGWLEPDAPTERRCASNYVKGKKLYPLRVKRKGEVVPYVCGGTMVVMEDERGA